MTILQLENLAIYCNDDTADRLTSSLTINQFDNSDYDALWDGRGDIAMHKPNGDIPDPRDLSHNCELSN